MIARVAAVFSSSSDWKENVLQVTPDYSQQQNKNTASNQYVTYQAGRKETCSHNFAWWRRGSCATGMPSLVQPILARIAARKGLGTVSRPDNIERAPCSIPCQCLGRATHKILKCGLYRRHQAILQSESMTAMHTGIQENQNTYRKGCENDVKS